ncbi:MAG: 30S ribosomal protein S8 [Candidatus Colwellbacteria bacterium]|nr:30S ribosomal protein S8 [Candidatus Colwellbacteria bacterium]
MYHDTLIRIQNGFMRGKSRVKVPYSQLDFSILELLTGMGYLEAVQRKGRGTKRIIDVKLKYHSDKSPALSKIKFVSRPSRPMYTGYLKLKPSHQGYGHFIVSTPQGIMDGMDAKRKKVGGQILFEVW